jgi:hypothetical protein
MIVVIDPAVFAAPSGAGPLDSQQDKSLCARLDTAQRILKKLRGAKVATRRLDSDGVNVPPCEVDSWALLQRSLIRPLFKRLSHDTKNALGQLRERITKAGCLIKRPSVPKGSCYGVRELFASEHFDEELCDEWSKLLCAATGEADEIVVIGALLVGRNAQDRSSADGTQLVERTRWRVYAHLTGRSPVAIDVLVHPRNVDERWTTRFDERLPGAGHCPFCPPREWHRRRTVSWKTLESKPCWIDANGLGWARPRTGGGYHWDVFLKNNVAIQASARVDQVNIVQHGAPASEGVEGAIHHPGQKKGQLNEDLSWSCPNE